MLLRSPGAVFVRRALTAAAAVLVLIGSGQPGGDDGAADAGVRAVPAARQARNVAIITIRTGDRMIDRYTSMSFERRLRAAEEGGADAVVVELDTPGGELGAVLDVCNLIKSSSIPNFVAWVNQDAYSGGAIIALACREIVVSDPASLGDAGIITLDPLGLINEQQKDYERQKMLVPLLAEVVDSARRNGYDEKFVQGFVSLGVELWQVENVETGRRLFIDRNEYTMLFGEDPPETNPILTSAPRRIGERQNTPAPPELRSEGADEHKFIPASRELAELADQARLNHEGIEIDTASGRPVLTEKDRGQWRLLHAGRRISDGRGFFVLRNDSAANQMAEFGLSSATITNDAQLRSFFGAENVVRLDQSWSEGLVRFLTMLPVRGVLIVVLLLGVFLEMVSPGLIVPGTLAAAALVALLAPPMIVGMASWWEVAAILGGIVLVILEIFVIPGFGVFGVVGLLALFAGLVGTFAPQGSDSLFPDTAKGQQDLFYGLVTIVLALGTAGVGMYFLSKHFGALPLFGRLVLKDAPDDEETTGNELLSAMRTAAEEIAVGMEGVAATPLRPAGKMEIDGRLVDVVADLGYIPEGAAVRVVQVTRFRVAVEPIEHGGERA